MLSVGGVGRARLCDWVGGGVLRLLVVSVVLLVLVLPLTGQSDWLELPSDPTLSYNSQNLQWIVNFQSRHPGLATLTLGHSVSGGGGGGGGWLYILVVPPLITYPRSEAKIGYSDHTNTANMAHNYYQP